MEEDDGHFAYKVIARPQQSRTAFPPERRRIQWQGTLNTTEPKNDSASGAIRKMDTITYLKNFVRDKNVASITPTSSIGVKTVCSRINFDSSNLIVEYGPGTGVFSNYLLSKMKSDTRLILIERNKNFDSILKNTIQDPRVVIVNDSAENVLETLRRCEESQADYVISGIPFLLLDCEMKHRILKNTHRALKKGGKFLVYQTCFQTNGHLKVHLERFFSEVHSRYEIMNIPPLRIYEATK